MPQNLSDVVTIFLRIIGLLLPLLMALSILAFFWGLSKFILKSGDEKAHEEGRAIMKWGLIGLFVMVSLLGILQLLYDDFGFARDFGIPLLPDGQQQS